MSEDTLARDDKSQGEGLRGIEDRALLDARVLVVEQHHDQAFLLESVLDQAGYRYVERAKDADEAIRRHALNPFDVMIIATRGQHGGMAETVLRLRRAVRLFVPLIVVIKDSDRNLVGMLVKAGIQDFITKPVDGIVLRMRLRNALEMKNLRVKNLRRSTSAVPLDECVLDVYYGAAVSDTFTG